VRFVALLLISALLATAQPPDPVAASVLELRLVEGDGTVYATGSRATKGLTVLVTDENGRPVEGATVSFALPNEGPGGTFATGGRTEIVTTRADGRANVWGMQWNRTPGAVDIRITAVKGQARAGMIAQQSLTNGPLPGAAIVPGGTTAENRAAPNGPAANASGGGHKWLWITLAIAGGAAAGAVGAMSGKSTATAAPPTVNSTVTIGAPTIIIGRP
jgi:hypothetical protein